MELLTLDHGVGFQVNQSPVVREGLVYGVPQCLGHRHRKLRCLLEWPGSLVARTGAWIAAEWICSS